MNQKKNNANLSHRSRYLIFHLEDEVFAVDIMSVREIIAMMKTTPIPKTPRYIKGVMNLRGNIIPVIDLRLKFQMPEKEPEMDTAIIILQVGEADIGFIVDHVEEVATIGDEQLSDAPAFGTTVNTDFIHKIARYDDRVIMILDVDKAFNLDELRDLENLAKTS
ncbi:chemotaxis protein CheW [Desulfurispirillum indicum]|uniref:Chemotaxis protein CheW n=1 Tax=Desulfurispirillum indicum (strain ATCC BAA-1389 / DSM 22839 / S5) TaxID=653733 RepID=E6W0A9_DESIS|nr:chemotaxis protein CheW [Desulfurispirillum indicum]ADU66327.1 CheW domain protein [Desulfurispirillum indicum S5]UCZ55661.1 chemotaxis protein CheW [Desulfurispirillum indicum]